MSSVFAPFILIAQGFVESYGLMGTFIISILEAFIFPVPTAFFIAPATALGIEPFWIAVVATVGSLMGAVAGYVLGYYLGHPVASKILNKKQLEKVELWYRKWGEWIVLIAAAGPIPFKVVTWFSGILELDFKKFMIFSAIGRTFQFFVAAYIGNFLGPWIIGVFL